MKCSFDNTRRRLVENFNTLVESLLVGDQIETAEDMRNNLIALICMYDNNDYNDCNDLSGELEIFEV